MNINEVNTVLSEADLLISEAEVKNAITRLAGEITVQLKDSCPIVMCVMNGGLLFTGQLLTQMVFNMEVYLFIVYR